MAKFISELTELEIGSVRFNKGLYITDDPDKIAFLEKIEALRRYRVRRIDSKTSDKALPTKKS
ncbi:MAG: hypothetical protein PHY27_14355 [Parabacteroides sp.]|nr:hypothetical protein [Parabacteroides sp.]